jgi:hypothetical protein
MNKIRKQIDEIKKSKTEFVCFEKNGVLFVPHYKHFGNYAYPGIKKTSKGYTEDQLRANGAQMVIKSLFIKEFF